jgi:hypothetical protein
MKAQIEAILKQILHGELRYMYFSSDKSTLYGKERQGLSYKGDQFALIHDKEIVCEKDPYMATVLIPSIPYHTFDFNRPRGYRDGSYDYNRLVCPIEEGISLVMTTQSGKINGSYIEGNGWAISVGINYHGMMVHMYECKLAGATYEVKGIWSEDFFKLIDYKNFSQVHPDDRYYISEYSVFYDSSGKADYCKLLELLVENDTFYWYDTILMVLGILSPGEKNKNALTALSKMTFTKFVAKNNVRHLYDLKLPPTCTHIDFDFLPFEGKKESYLTTDPKGMLKESLTALVEYAALFDEKYQKDGKKTQDKVEAQRKLGTHIMLTFKYKGLWSTIYTNMYAYEKMQAYYAKNDAQFDICDTIMVIPYKIMLKSIKMSTKITKTASKAEEFFGGKIGNTDWWLEEFDKVPKNLYE